MNEYQKHAIECAQHSDSVYCTEEYHNRYFKSPLLGKRINEIEYDRVKKGDPTLSKEVRINGDIYKSYYDDLKPVSKACTIIIITKNDIIIYWKSSSIGAPGQDAWEILTNTFMEYIPGTSDWRMISTVPFESFYYYSWMPEKERTRKYPTRICTQEEIDAKLKETTYHL